MLKIFVSLIIFLTSLTSFSSNSCLLKKRVISEHSSPEYNRRLFTSTLNKNFKAKTVNSWQECFDFAVSIAHGLDMKHGEYVSQHLVYGSNIKGDIFEDRMLYFEEGYLFIEWTFDDTLVFPDSKGRVNKYTAINDPKKGDLRAYSNNHPLVVKR